MTSKWEKTARVKKQKLSPRHNQLVNYYFGVANFNKTSALRMAGYGSPHNYIRLFSHPRITEEVERRFRELREKYKVNYDRIIEEVAKIAFSNVLDYGMIDQKTGDILFDFKSADAATLAAIGEVTVETYTEGRGENAREVKRVRVKPWNKLTALDHLMKHTGASKDKGGEVLADLAGRLTAGLGRLGKKKEN